MGNVIWHQWARYQAIAAAFCFIDGGIISLFYPFPTFTGFYILDKSLFKPTSIPGVLSLAFGVIMAALEYDEKGLYFLGAAGRDLRARFALYTIFAIVSLQQLSTVIGFEFLVLTNISLLLAMVKGEFVGMKKN